MGQVICYQLPQTRLCFTFQRLRLSHVGTLGAENNYFLFSGQERGINDHFQRVGQVPPPRYTYICMEKHTDQEN